MLTPRPVLHLLTLSAALTALTACLATRPLVRNGGLPPPNLQSLPLSGPGPMGNPNINQGNGLSFDPSGGSLPGRRYAQRNDFDPNGGLSPLAGPSAPIFFRPINGSTWRTRIPAASLYPIVLRHLSESYIIRSHDPRTLSIQTDWDKFFIGGRLFRNRINVTLFPLGGLDSEMVVNNKVEYFQSSQENSAYGDSDWIPTQDVTNEKTQLIEALSRIVHSLNLASRVP